MASKLITISIRKYLVTQPRTKRMRKAATYIRERVSHYMKVDLDKVKFSRDLNNEITAHSLRMKPVKLSIDIDKGIATASLFKEQAAKDKTPKASEQKQTAHAAKTENKDVEKKGGAQTAKERPAPERAQKRQENATRTADAANMKKSPENERNATLTEKSQK